jgi:hypothetical protein
MTSSDVPADAVEVCQACGILHPAGAQCPRPVAEYNNAVTPLQAARRRLAEDQAIRDWLAGKRRDALVLTQNRIIDGDYVIHGRALPDPDWRRVVELTAQLYNRDPGSVDFIADAFSRALQVAIDGLCEDAPGLPARTALGMLVRRMAAVTRPGDEGV